MESSVVAGVWSKVARGAVSRAVIFSALALLVAALLSLALAGSAMAAPPYQVQHVTTNSTFDGDPAVYGGRVAWIGADGLGSALFVFDGLTGATREVSRAVSAYSPKPVFYGNLIVWLSYEDGGAVVRGFNVATGEQRLVATLKNSGTDISTDGRYIAWSDYAAPGEPSDIVLYDWTNGAIEKISNDRLDEYDAMVRDGFVTWERESATDPENMVDVLLYDTRTALTTTLTSQAQRYRLALLDAGRVVWLEGPYDAAVIMLYQIGASAAEPVLSTPSNKQLWDFTGDKIVWTDGWMDTGETYVFDTSTAVSTRLSQNSVADALAQTDGRLVTWLEAGTPNLAHIYDCVSQTSYVLNESGQTAGAPSVDLGRAVWFEGMGAAAEVMTVTWPLFNDVPSAHPYFSAIQSLAEKRLVDGYPAANGGMDFKPDNPVFRAQYAKMIDGALDLVPSETMTPPIDFTDLGQDNPKSLYPHEYVWTAYKNQIVFGYSDGTFRPYADIQRGHVLTMTVRALQSLHPGVLVSVPASFVQTWGLGLLVEHKANARIAEYNNLLTNLPPDNEVTGAEEPMPRQEVAQVMYNMMRLIPSAAPYPPD